MKFFKILPLLTFTVFSNVCQGEITSQTVPQATMESTSATTTKLFSGDRAMEDLVRQVEGGPRLPDSPGLKLTRDLITSTLESNNFEVGTQAFNAKSPQLGYEVSGLNIFGVYPKGAKVKYIISAHYDTRPYADQDPNPSKRQEPVPGANDGASGVAVLLELARCIPQANLSHGVALVFFDLEDHGVPSADNTYCLGSREFARNLPAQVKDFQHGINLDMVADLDLRLPMEGWSLSKAPKLTFDLWRHASKLYPQVWPMEKGPSIYDDHMPFLAAGHQYIDVIDIDYAYWHTTLDTPDKCSSQNLEIVGDTIFTFIKH